MSVPGYNWFYETSCLDTPYTRLDHEMDVIYQRTFSWNPYPYYMIQSQIPRDLTAYWETDEVEECREIPGGVLRSNAVRVTNVPEGDIPFTLPVTLPLRYEYK